MYEVTNERNFIQATAYNEADQLYYGFYSNYQVFNPKTGKLIFKKEIEDIEKYDLEPYINAIYDDKLWFVSGRGLQTKFGYINIQTQQIELLQDFPQEEDEFFDAPIYHDGKLYLRGKHFNNLYVFEQKTNSLDQIKWKIYGQNFTKADFEKYLKENREAIEKLPIQKIENLLPDSMKEGLRDTNKYDRIYKQLIDNYEKIFIK